MTEDVRRRFESFETLRAAAYTSFNDRRGHEWKLALSIWTSLAILLAGLIQPAKSGESFPLHGRWPWVLFAVAGLALVFLHGFWSSWASRANRIDQNIFLHLRDKMLAEIKSPLPDDVKAMIAQHPRPVGWYQTPHLVQVSITALLSVGAILVVYARSS
jgi:hypothetical protein